MHLKCIRLRGFKSFQESTEIRLEPGVAVVVGPNGSGKSNVADAILWAAGSQSPSELRAERADDVLFAGSGARGAVGHCEVELVFDNADGVLAELDFSEVSIARRLHRGGEGQYLVNGATVRRLDVVELLSDVGLGGGLGSIIGQGRVEAVLGAKPDDLRGLIEEAAGLGKFKRRRHRAELKLTRVAQQTERARDLEAEVTKRLRPLALQATAAERAERLGGEIGSLRAALAALDLRGVDARLVEVEERARGAALERALVGRRLHALLERRVGAEEELADAAGRREAQAAALYRLRSARDRLDLRAEAARDARIRLETELAASEEAGEGARILPELERRAALAAELARAAAAERDSLGERARLARERLGALERALAEREGLPPAARELAERGERLVLAQLDVEPGLERAVAAALGPRASALVAQNAEAGLALLERARDSGLGSLRVVVVDEPSTLLADLRVVPHDELLVSSEPAVTVDGFGYDPLRGELWFVGEAAEAVLLELEARRRSLVGEAVELAEGASAADVRARALAGEAGRAAAAVAELRPARRLAPPERLRPLLRGAERLLTALTGAGDAAARFESPLQARVDAGAVRTGELAAALRGLGAEEAELRRTAAEAGERASSVDVDRARLQAEQAQALARLEAAGADPAEGEDRDTFVTKLERLERRREQLGSVNPFAKQEYETEKARLTDLTEQRADLEGSLRELERLRAELTETVERRFEETFAAVAANFEEVAATLFPGGHGRLSLTEPEEGEEGGQPGVEVELRPAGKRVTRLSLLSGGEKALGAISFLFSLFLARPSPFYLLDEVEAALDDANIGRFVELLRRYADRAQFIVVTHQKRTMEAADVLYGVTMGPDGVSEIVSKRLPREGAVALASA